MSEAQRKWTYPLSWDEPWREPPPPISDSLRDAFREAHARTLAMTPAEKQAMYEAQRRSFIRAMAPCEHGDPDWETCPKCRFMNGLVADVPADGSADWHPLPVPPRSLSEGEPG